MAATLASGKLNPVAFRAALALQHYPGGREILEITSPRHNRVRHGELIVHESRHLSELDVMYIENIPVTRPARTLNDVGLLVETGELSESTWDHALHDAIRRNQVDIPRMWHEWERLGGALRPGGEMVEKMLRRFTPPTGDTDSSPEIRLLQIIRDHGFPEPVQQHRVWVSRTNWYDLDHSWPDLKRYAEFNGFKFHGNRDKAMKDAKRLLRLQDLGWDGVVVTDDELDEGAELAMRVLNRKLHEASLRCAERT